MPDNLPATATPRIVVIGGGTGSFTLLGALKTLTPDITALVNMADDGGSTGVLRDELGVLPPGDVRQCLVALSRSAKMRDLFDYRFSEGTFSGHSFGNIFLTALEKLTGDFGTAVETASEVLNIRGRVVPITLDNVRLVLEGHDGSSVQGEHLIDAMRFDATGMRPLLSLEPMAHINPKAAAAIRAADVVVLAPGDLYTSLGPLLIVDGVKAALQRSRAKVVYVCNLVVKPGQTTGLSVADHAAEIERFIGAPRLNYVLYNTRRPSPELLKRYVRDEEYLVMYHRAECAAKHYQAVGRPLIAKRAAVSRAGDALAARRSFIRHDATAVARFIHTLTQ